MNFDPNPIIQRVRVKVQAVAAQLHLDCAEDVAELPVRFSKHHAVSLCGHFERVAADGLGRIEIFKPGVTSEEKLENTLIHEFAHALVHYLRKGWNTEEPHGQTFQYIMLALGHEPSRYVLGKSDGRAPETVYQKKK